MLETGGSEITNTFLEGTMGAFESLVEVLVNDDVPVIKLTQLKPGFKIQRAALEVMLFSETPKSKEDAEKLTENTGVYIEMLLSGKVLSEKDNIFTAGDNFAEFIKEAVDYLNIDNVIIRILDISKQDFDDIVREYDEIAKSCKTLDDIMSRWQSLSPDNKMSIIRGILLQRSIMASVINTMKRRLIPIMRNEQETLNWLNGIQS